MKRTIKGADILTAYVTATGGAFFHCRIEGGHHGRFRVLLPDGRTTVDLELSEVDVEDEAPALADALHKLAEQAERNTRLADALRCEQARYTDIVDHLDITAAKHAEEVEELHRELADERATAAALARELKEARATSDICQGARSFNDSMNRFEHLMNAVQALHRPSVSPSYPPLNHVDQKLAELARLIVYRDARKEFRKARESR